jgi:DNA replication protein DnaC
LGSDLAELENRIDDKLRIMKVPMRLRELATKEFNLDLQPAWDRDDAHKWLSDSWNGLLDGKWVTLRGPAGIGKTHLAVRWLWNLRKRKLDFCTANFRFLSSRTWSRDMAMAGFRAEEVAEELGRVKVIVLDDLGQEGDIKRSQAICDLIWDSFNECKQMIITTNLSNDEIIDRYGDACLSRMQGEGNRILNLNGRDCR